MHEWLCLSWNSFGLSLCLQDASKSVINSNIALFVMVSKLFYMCLDYVLYVNISVMPGLVFLSVHVDGTCRHRERMSSTRIMTLRSFIWKDTAQNEESQSCSIEIKSYSLYYISYTVKLCSEWDFHYTPCGVSVSVQQNKPSLILDDGHSPSFTCNTTRQKISDYKGMDKCTDAGPLRGPFIEVKRNIAPTAVESLQDGALFFETELRLVKERKYGKRGEKGELFKLESSSSSVTLILALKISCKICIYKWNVSFRWTDSWEY